MSTDRPSSSQSPEPVKSDETLLGVFSAMSRCPARTVGFTARDERQSARVFP